MTAGNYSYDANGRRLTGNGWLYEYDTDDRLISAANGGTSVAYDYAPEGWMTGKTVTTGSSTDQTNYFYASTGQLLGVIQHVNGQTADPKYIDYEYNVLGQRAAKLVNNAVVEKYLWAGMNMGLLAVYDGSDQLKARFEYAGERLPVAMEQLQGTAKGRYYLAYDQVGSLRAVFTEAGALVHTVEYDAWGNINPLTEYWAAGYSAGNLCIPFGFAGGLHDRDTGLVLFGYRNYDPETGRWTSKDPIGLRGGSTNVYEYCGNDPVRYIDPAGLELVTADEGVAIVEEARKWIGTPYQSPGETMGKDGGADCIGVVHGTYAALGYHYRKFGSREFSNSIPGKYQSPWVLLGEGDVPQAGDVLWWPGHVAIYDPNPPVDQHADWGYGDNPMHMLGARTWERTASYCDLQWWENKYGKAKVYRYYKPDIMDQPKL